MRLVRRGLRPELLPLELALVAAIFCGDESGYVPLSKTPFLSLIAWASLRLRHLRWRDVGLSLPAAWPRFAAIGLASWILAGPDGIQRNRGQRAAARCISRSTGC